MEVVHSRAFCGNFGVNGGGLPSKLLLSLPLLAGVIGYYYYIVIHGQNDLVLAGLASIAGIPGLASIISKDTSVAVLLPLIDSANHIETADSSIVFDPLRSCFQLQCGPKCFVSEDDDKTQLFVSYGPKTDTELLLNYGFLPNVPCSEGNDEAVRDQQHRRRLADAFQARSS